MEDRSISFGKPADMKSERLPSRVSGSGSGVLLG